MSVPANPTVWRHVPTQHWEDWKYNLINDYFTNQARLLRKLDRWEHQIAGLRSIERAWYRANNMSMINP